MHLSRFPILLLLAIAPSALAQQSPLIVTSRLPDNNAKSVCADTLLSITFNRPPTLGTAGKIRIFDSADDKLIDTLDLATPINAQTYTIQTVPFHAYPVLITGNTATIHPHADLLAPGKTYYVQLDPGVITGFPGYADKTSWTFTTKPAPTPAEKYIIAADGTGDFATLQGALDFVPAMPIKPITLLLRQGTYTEIVSMVGKSNLIILGEDRDATIITYANNEQVQLGANSSSKRGVINISRSTGVVFANLTLRNATPKGGGPGARTSGGGGGWQAETIIGKNNSQIILTNVSLYSFQDTLQMSSPGYVANSYIEGDVDFMWGTGPCFFQDCQLKSLTNNDCFVVSRNTAQGHGFIYNNCRFAVKEGVTGDWLAQNQGYVNSEVVLLNCAIAPTINPIAWRVQGQTGHYWEFNSTNTTDGKPADVSTRLAGSKRLTQEADADTLKNYSDPAFILAGWKPALAPIITRQPESQVTGTGGAATFTAAAIAVPAATYQWAKDGIPIPNATQATFKIAKAATSDAGAYTVTVTNASGKAASAAAVLSIR